MTMEISQFTQTFHFLQFEEKYTTFKALMLKERMSMTPSLIMFKTDLNDKAYTGSKIHENARFHRIGEDLSGNVKLEHSP